MAATHTSCTRGIDASARGRAASYAAETKVFVRDNSFLRISGIHQCRRQIAYRRSWFVDGRDELPMWTHSYALFDVGHGIHLRLQERLGNTGALAWVDGEPAIDDHGHFGFNGLFEVPLISHQHRLRGTLDCLSRPLREKTVRVKSTGYSFKTYAVTTDDDPLGKRYIIDLKSITARDRCIVDEDPNSGEILKAERKPSGFEKLVQPKDEHLGQTMLYSYLVTQPDFQSDRLGGKPLATPPDVMIIYQAKDIDPKFYAKHPDDYPPEEQLLHGPFKIFTVPYDQRRVDALLQKAKEVWAHIDNGDLPGRDFKHIPSRPAWACVDCAFRKDCYQKEGYFNDAIDEEPVRVQYLRRQLERRHEPRETTSEPATAPAGAGAESAAEPEPGAA